MIAFSPIRTRRLSVQLKEMTVADAIYLCKLRPDLYEAGTTELLRRIVEEDLKPRAGQVTDARLWTVQERALAVAHYIAHTSENGGDFDIGDGHFSDYLLDGADFAADSIPVGDVDGDKWNVRPLLGVHAEAIERLVTSGRLDAARHGWWIGAMAAQLFRDGEEQDLEASDAEIEEWIEGRVDVFKAFPESAFMQLLPMYLSAVAKQDHLFRLGFSDDGIVFLSGEAGTPPARFPFSTALTEASKAVFGNATEPVD